MGKILVVDDEEPIGAYLSRLIGTLKKTEPGQAPVPLYDVKVVLNAKDAFAELEKNVFGLVIADLRLPDAPNTEQWISQLCQRTNGAKVVLISGMLLSPELEQCAKENNILTFLSKPFELAFVKKILKDVFGE
jgi:Response regulator containing CheY-like receiver, AAA-type ATPase, and DNA-binding domains